MVRLGQEMGKRIILENKDKIAEYFNTLAEKWDDLQNIPKLNESMHNCLKKFRIDANEKILDVGCGTGNLVTVILKYLSPLGRVDAIDISPAMIERARSKVKDDRVTWRIANVLSLPIGNNELDRVICYSVWPHIKKPESAVAELYRVLRDGGKLHICHSIPRNMVNAIHTQINGPVGMDRLPPAEEVVKLLKKSGFEITDKIDNNEKYLISAVK